jgi:fructokinase
VERDVLVVGEALIDIVRTADGRTAERAGGSAANVAVALSRLGRPVRFATCFADDAYGDILRAHLAGITLASDPGAAERTSSALAEIGADGAASYTFDLDWRLNPVDGSGPTPRVVHTSSLGAVLSPGADDVRALVADARADATISYDINARPVVTGTGPEVVGRVEQLVAMADVVKASDEDLEAFWPGVGLEESADRLLGLGPAAVVITRGQGGAFFRTPQGEGVTEAVRVTVADTIGAGDTFGAALIDGLWERGLLGADRRADLRALDTATWGEVLAWASRAAAVTVSRPGADPPYRSEL